MVAIVGGSALGLSLGSISTLGMRGAFGGAAGGRSGEQAYVNAVTGNLILRDQDDLLVGHGVNAAAVRTYNSQGKRNDDNADNWSSGVYAQQLRLTGTRNTAGSTLVRTDRDGAESVYTWDGAKYASKAGAGAYDALAWDNATSQYVWSDGDSGTQERYDGVNGRLLSTKDVRGNTLAYGYNGAGLLTSVLDASGEQTFYDYAGSNLTQIRTVYLNAGVSTTLTRVRYGYDTSNRLSTVTVDLSPNDNSVADGKFYRTTYTYDGTSQRVASASQSDGTSLVITYVQVGTEWRVQTLKDALNNTTTFTYDTVARRTTVRDPLNLPTLYDYDTQGQLTKVTSPPVGGVSESVTFSYTANGELLRMVDGEGRGVDYGYDANGNQTLQRDAAGNTVTRTWNARNQIETETVYATPDPDGAGAGQPAAPMVGRYVYDVGGKNLLRFAVSAEGRVTEYQYNSYGERTAQIEYAKAAYDLTGLGATAVPTEAQMTTWVAAQDKTRTMRTDYLWDVRGQLQKTTSYGSVDAAGNGVADTSRAITQYVYDQAGLLLQTISATAGTTLYTYDGLGRVLTTRNALLQTTVAQYDDAGAKTAITLASGLTTTSAYDRAGRLVSVIDSSSAAANLGETKYFYDADSRLRMTQDPTGVRQWLIWDDIGRKVADVDATGTLTEYAYDKNDRLTRTITYATAVATTALVDGGGNPTNVTLAAIRPTANAADRSSWRAYDTAGRLVKTVDPTGSVVALAYDGASRLTSSTAYATLIATGALGNQPSAASIAPAANGADRVARSFWDADGRPLAALDGEGYLSENQYDAAGRLVVALRYATATPVAQRAAGTLAQLRPVASPDDQKTTFLFNAKGQVAGIVDAELYLTEKVYDNDGNLAKTVRYATRLAAAPAAGVTVASVRPTANGEDQVTTWLYDLLDRVSQQTNAEGTITKFAYDAVGHLVTTTKAFGQAEVRAISARYDVQGRLTGELTGEGGAQLTGGLTQAQIDAVWAQYGLTHAYDAAGRRISTVDQNGNKTLFFYDVDGRLTHSVNALGEVRERQYDTIGRLSASIGYATRISTAGLAGGLVPGALNTAINAVKDATKDAKVSYTYFTSGNVASATDALGNVTTSTWNAFGEQVGQVSAVGAGVTRTDAWSYDRRGLQTGSAADTAGINAIASAIYDAFGRRSQSVDANGNLTRQSFDRLGRTVQAIAADNTARSSSYDAFDRVLTQTDALNQTTSYAYSTSARSVTVTTAEGITMTTVRTRHGQTQSIKDGKGQTTSYTYDRNGNLLSTSDPLTVTRQAYDKADRLIETTDARGYKVAYAYDNANRLFTRRVDPTGLNLLTTYAWDALGRQVTVTDALGIQTSTTYDRKGQALTQAVDPTGLNLVTRWSYDARGKVLTVTSATGAVAQYTYDKLGRRTQEQVDPSGLNLKRSWTYDKNGNAVTATDANNQLTRYAYDAMDRMVWSVDAAGDTARTEYDAEGRVARITRYATPISLAGLPAPATAAQIQARVVTSAGKDAVDARRYDKDGRLRFVVDGTGAVVELRYDSNGNATERIAYVNTINVQTWTGTTDPTVTADATRDRRTRTMYDALDRATYIADATGAVTLNGYDLNGNLIRQTQYATAIVSTTAPNGVVANPADRVAVFTYDAANRETWRADAFGAVTKTDYDADGNAVKSTRYANLITPGGTPSTVTANAAADRITRREFDKANRLTYTADPLGYVTGTTYDAVGRVRTTTRYWLAVASAAAPSSITVNAANDRTDTYTYDLAGRLKTSTDAIGGLESFTYDGLGNKLTFTNKKGSVWTYAYDAAGRLISETSPQVELTGVQVLGGNLYEGTTTTAAIVTHLAYDGLGNLRSRTEAFGRPEVRTTSYDYDAVGRQIKVTFPPIAVYNESTAGLTTNGATGLPTRAEATPQALSALTYYDALGNAVANVDVAGSVSLKAYDLAGRVAYEVDGLGFVTAYGRNAFGEATAVTRYGAATGLASATPTSAAQAPNAGAIAATLGAAGFDHSADRLLTTAYDKLGRAATVTEPPGFVYDSTGQTATAGGTSTDSATKQTVNTFNAFGELVKVAQARTASAWNYTYRYFDKAGQQLAVVDAMGFLATRTYDAVGNLTSVTEHANALASGGWTATTYGTPVASADTRATTFAYDRLNRKTSETRVQILVSTVGNGTSARANVTTGYGWDAVGNLTKTTDALGASTYTYYDALGRITGVAAPARNSTVDGSNLIPLTTFRRDAYGNVIVKMDRANSALAAAEFTGVSSTATPGYTTGLTSPDDRYTTSNFDVFGHATQTTDATGVSHYFSYNGRGQLAKTWQTVEDNYGAATTTLFEAYQYDKLGRVTHTLDPAPTVTAGLTDTALEYNAFGEVTNKGVNGGRQEYFDYDTAGHLWRTNAGDGVDKIFLYDRLGRQTSDIRSSGSGLDNRDLHLVPNASDAAALNTTRRTDTVYDALGRVTSQIQPKRTDTQAGIRVVQQYNTAAVASTAIVVGHDESSITWSGSNQVNLSWSSLAGLGSGDVKVDLYYKTASVQIDPPVYDEGALVSPATYSRLVARTRTVTMTSDQGAAGASITWDDPEHYDDVGGVGAVDRFVVYKRDVQGNWVRLIDRTAAQIGLAGNTIEVVAPADSKTTAVLQMRAYGSTAAFATYTTLNFGSGLRYDAALLQAGSYEYRIQTTVLGQPTRTSANGMLKLADAPVAAIGGTIAFTSATSGIFAWPTPDVGSDTQVFRYRIAGSGATWSTRPVVSQGAGRFGVDTNSFSAATYEFELQWLHAAAPLAYKHATGTFVVTTAVAPVDVPAVGVPNLTGLSVGSRVVGSSTIVGVSWNVASSGTPTFSYRTIGSSTWSTLGVTTASGVGYTTLESVAAANYEFKVEYKSGATTVALGTGNLTVKAPGQSGSVLIRYEGTGEPIYGDVVRPAPPDPTPYILYTSAFVRPTYFQDLDAWGNPAAVNGGGPIMVTGSTDGGTYTGSDGPDMLQSFNNNATLRGGAGDDILGSGGAATGVFVYDGGAGDDQLRGLRGNGATNYAMFGRGDGHDFVPASYHNGTIRNILKFKPGIVAADVQVSLVHSLAFGANTAIRFTIADTGDTITFEGFFVALASNNSKNMVQEVQFDDGSTWTFAQIAARITSQGNAAVSGTSGNDVMTGTAGSDYLLGNAGNDTLDGRAGDDVLDGGLGNNTYLFGYGDGHDTIAMQVNPNASRVNTLRLKAGVLPSDVVVRQVSLGSTWFESGLEVRLKSTGETVTIAGFYSLISPTNTRAWIPIQQIVFEDGTTWDVPQIDQMVYAGTSGNDRMIAVGPATLHGGAGSDLIVGSDGADTLYGGSGDDIIVGRGGDDLIVGGAGRDRLWGGPGNTTYEFRRGDGQDLITPGTNQGVGGTNNILRLPDIASTEVRIRTLSYNSYYFELSVIGSTDLVYIYNYSNQYLVNEIHFSDGVVWDAAEMAAHLDTSARPVYAAPVSLGPDPSGQFDVFAKGYYWQDNVLVARSYTEWGIVGYNQQPIYGDLTITTPPYTPGYTIPGAPKQYGASVTTPALSSTISGPASLSASLTLTSSANGDAVSLRPVVNQKYDRWGNVIETSDPRSAAWKTTYTYNANNQVVDIKQPDAAGAQSGTSPLTTHYYSALGQELAVKDARGSVNAMAYDAAGNLVRETHADGGIVTYAFNAFSDKVRITDAVGNDATGANAAYTKAIHTTGYTYDKLGRLVATTHGAVGVWTILNDTSKTLSNLGTQNLSEISLYDKAGRKIRQTDGGGRVTENRYDRAGNVIETRKAGSSVVKSTWDALGHKLSDTDQNGNGATWSYDYFGRLQSGRTDIGGATYTYAYDKAMQLVSQTNSRGQNLAYAYDAAGQLTSLTDASLGQVTSYAYDFSGRRVLERTMQGSTVYQDNHLGYDTLGRLRLVDDGHVHLQMDYDAVGNRTRIQTKVNVALAPNVGQADDIRSDDRWFQYDAMNRQTVVDAFDAAGNTGFISVVNNGNTDKVAHGHRIAYDKNGNRTSDSYWGNRVVTTTATTTSYDEDGNVTYSDTQTTYKTVEGTTVESYGYDALDRLQSVDRDGTQVDLRFYDGSSNVVQTGPNGNLPVQYAAELNKNVPQDSTIGVEQRKNLYDSLGRLTLQRVNRSDATKKYEITYTYDAAGNVSKYRLYNYDGPNSLNEYTYSTVKLETYHDTDIAAHGYASDAGISYPLKLQDGSTHKTYDANGFLSSTTDSKQASSSHAFVNDAAGRVLQATQNGNVQRQLVVNGEVLGRYGIGTDDVKPRAVSGSNAGTPLFKPVADFNFGYQPINGNYPTASAGTYAVQAGDTLQSIARGAYGDAQLWYRIAEANGLSGNADLRVGQTLTIPSKVGTVHNTDQTYKPYDPTKVAGDPTPYMAQPSASNGGCGGIGLILVIVVAIVVTVFTAGVAAAAIAPGVSAAAGTAVAGTSLAAGGGIAGTFAVGAAALTGTYGATIGIVAGAIGAAVGSVVSQGVGVAIGVQQSFSWKQVALSAISGGVSGGIAGYASGTSGLLGSSAVARAAVSNALSQGVGIVTGLQHNFNWQGVAASAAGAGVGSVVGEAVGSSLKGVDLSSFAKGVISGTAAGFAGGVAAAVVKGGRIEIAQIAADSFGNALGSGLADEIKNAGLPAAIREMGQEQREYAQRIAQRWQIDPSLEEHAANLTDIVRMAFEKDVVSDKRRADLTDFALKARGLDEHDRAEIMNALRSEQVLPEAPTPPAGIQPTEANRIAGDAIVLGPVLVTGPMHPTNVALGARTVDWLGINTGRFVENVSEYIEQRPLIGIAVEVLNIASAPVAYAVTKAIGATPLGQAIEDGQRRITTSVSSLYSEAGYDSEDAGSGGVGAMAVVAAAVGLGATKVLGFARSALERIHGERSIVVPPPVSQINSSWTGGVPGQRVTTVTRQMSDQVQGMGYLDPLTNTFKAGRVGETMSVDHILPVRDVSNLPGFRSLTKEQMENILQDKINVGNLQPLPQSLNSSKGSRVDGLWKEYKDQPLNQDYVKTLKLEQVIIRDAIVSQIVKYQAINSGGH